MEELIGLLAYETLGRKRANRRQVLMPVLLDEKIPLSALYLFSLDTIEPKVVSLSERIEVSTR